MALVYGGSVYLPTWNEERLLHPIAALDPIIQLDRYSKRLDLSLAKVDKRADVGRSEAQASYRPPLHLPCALRQSTNKDGCYLH